MKTFSILCVLTLSVITLTACTSKEPPPLRSPCVSAEDGPCAKRPANPGLMQAKPSAFKAQNAYNQLMAVYTKLDEQDFANILTQFDIGTFVAAKGIAEGVENTNYMLETDRNKFILTVYEERVKDSDLPFFIGLMDGLAQNNIPAPLPLKAKDGSAILKYNGKSLTIVSFLEGRSPTVIKNAHIQQIGEFQAKIHNCSAKLPQLQRENALSISFWREMIEKIGDKGDAHFPGITQKISDAFAQITANWPKNMPVGLIHADLFPDNVFFQDERLSAILDFYMACNDICAYDISITLNAWCFEPDFSFNITKAKLLLSAYNNHRKLTEAELDALPILCAGSALRFLLTRLYAYLNQSEGALVKVKNPIEYLRKMEFHLQVKSHYEYGL